MNAIIAIGFLGFSIGVLCVCLGVLALTVALWVLLKALGVDASHSPTSVPTRIWQRIKPEWMKRLNR